MRRKIPGRKHRGVRDPEKQNALRLEKLKKKINNPPTNIDEQQVPKSVEHLRILCDKVKNGEFKKRKRSKKQPKMYQKLPHENEQQYVHRIKNICDTLNGEVEFEKKYGVQIKRDNNGDVIGVLKHDKKPIELLHKDKKKSNQTKNEKLTKSQRRQLKLREKKQHKELEERTDIEIESKLIDTVRFGEQVHAPPVLTIPKKAKKIQDDNDITRKPGQKNLLLKTMFDTTNVDGNKLKTSNKIDRKGKRKDLPNALRRQLEKQQKEVIEAYKVIKLKKKQELT